MLTTTLYIHNFNFIIKFVRRKGSYKYRELNIKGKLKKGWAGGVYYNVRIDDKIYLLVIIGSDLAGNKYHAPCRSLNIFLHILMLSTY